MPADLTKEPWVRLAALAPPGVTEEAQQQAADRHALNADLNGALADLWEEAANAIDVTPPAPVPPTPGAIKSVSQDGISVTYADTPMVDTHSARVSQAAAYMAKARYYRSRKKVKSVKKDGRFDDPYERYRDDEDRIIPVIP